MFERRLHEEINTRRSCFGLACGLSANSGSIWNQHHRRIWKRRDRTFWSGYHSKSTHWKLSRQFHQHQFRDAKRHRQFRIWRHVDFRNRRGQPLRRGAAGADFYRRRGDEPRHLPARLPGAANKSQRRKSVPTFGWLDTPKVPGFVAPRYGLAAFAATPRRRGVVMWIARANGAPLALRGMCNGSRFVATFGERCVERSWFSRGNRNGENSETNKPLKLVAGVGFEPTAFRL
jgi:hypothetical protein